jgi:hypothetical protein
MKTHDTDNKETSMLPEGFEPASERPQTHALDRGAIRIDLGNTSRVYIARICRGYVILISAFSRILIRS